MPFARDSVGRQALAKTARADTFPVIGSVHTARLPAQAPVQPRSFQPFTGAAVRRNCLKEATEAVHCPGHAIPELAPRIVPLPETRTVSL